MMMRCQHCGHEVPEGSVFCNRCGYRLNTEITCEYCHQPMPAGSVFCPHCGKAASNAMSIASAHTAAEQPKAVTYNQQRQQQQRLAAQQQQRRAENAWKSQPEEDDDDQDGNDDGGKSNFDRNLIIGIVAAVILIALLSLMRHCNSRENDRLEARADSAALVADSSQDPMAIFNAELSRNNLTDDKAYVGCAIRFASTDPDTPERIVGVTYKEDTDRPFVKIYTLTHDGAQWKTELGQTKYFDCRTIIMDNSSLIADAMNVPRAVTVDGKQCLYFAFLNHLKGAGEGNNGRDGFDGARYRNVVATYLHGPLLAKNPEIADWLIEKALARRAAENGSPAPALSALDDRAERAANAFMCAKLGVRAR